MNSNSIRLLCLAVGLFCLCEQLYGAKIVKRQDQEFICPDDGKWPHDTSCGKYYHCKDGIVKVVGWCGPKMSFDADNQRCEMAYGINCKDGDRPDWVPPDNWMGTTRSTTTTTRRTRRTQSTRSTIASGSDDLTTVPEGAMKENDDCSFTGLMPDKGNCERYFYCKDNKAHRATCIVNNFFDEETKSCKASKSVECGERPISSEAGNRCKSRPNGIYPNYLNGCSEFYHCNNQEEVKKGDCPKGLKFNSQTLRCDFAVNVLAPCGTKPSFGNAGSTTHPLNFVIVLLVNSAMSIYFL